MLRGDLVFLCFVYIAKHSICIVVIQLSQFNLCMQLVSTSYSYIKSFVTIIVCSLIITSANIYTARISVSKRTTDKTL